MNRKTQSVYNTILKGYPDVLDVDQVSEILKISTKTVYKIVKNGALSCLRVGRQIRVPKYFLLQYLEMIEKNDK